MSLREFRELRARPPGGWGREFGAVPIYAVNPARPPPPRPSSTAMLNSGVWPPPGWCACLEGSSVFQKDLALRTEGQGFPGGVGERNISHCLHCCLGPRNLPSPPVFCQGDPGPEILPAAPQSRRGERKPSAEGLRPRSRFTYCVPTLHPFSFLPPFPRPPCQPPQRGKKKKKKKARGNSRLLVAERGSAPSGSGPSSQGPRRSRPRRCLLLSPQPRLCSKRPGTLPKSPRGLRALCAPLLPYGTESHDVFKQSQRKPSPSSLFGVLPL